MWLDRQNLNLEGRAKGPGRGELTVDCRVSDGLGGGRVQVRREGSS